MQKSTYIERVHMARSRLKWGKAEVLIEQPLDKESFIQLYHQNVQRIYRYAFARVGSHAEAEDITSQVFLGALTGMQKIKNPDNLTAWLFTIARNKIVDGYRQKHKELPMEDLSEVSDHQDLLANIVQAETSSNVSTLLADLPAAHIELLELRFAGELTYAQIGEVVGKSEAAVKMAIRRLLDQLQAQMEQNHG